MARGRLLRPIASAASRLVLFPDLRYNILNPHFFALRRVLLMRLHGRPTPLCIPHGPRCPLLNYSHNIGDQWFNAFVISQFLVPRVHIWIRTCAVYAF